MNKKYFFTAATLSVLSVALIVFASPSDIQYPVKELGNCGSETACRVYCDNSANTEVCLNFAEKNGLMTADEIQTARKFLEAGAGPGGCVTKDSCETYCDSIDHMDECISFAEKNGLMPAKELEEAKKVQAAKNRGVKMPACGSKKNCDNYCSEAAHMEECITFAQEAGFMSSQELEESKKVLAAIKAGATPPPCKGKEECDVYCSEEAHFDACLDFALAAGFMDPKDAEMARKTKGKGPGNCRGKEGCDAFCQQEGNMEICARFAYDNGMMTQEEFEMFKKTGGKGPGGCKSKEECESFCDNPDNQETCFNFAKENGLIPEEDIRRMEEGKQQFQQSMQDIPPEVYSCLESLFGAEMMSKFKNGEAMPTKEIGDRMRECFEKNINMKEGPQKGQENMQPGDEEHGFAPGTDPDSMGKPPCEGEECQVYQEEYEKTYKEEYEKQYEQYEEQYKEKMMQFQPPQMGEQPALCEGPDCPQSPPPPTPPLGEKPASEGGMQPAMPLPGGPGPMPPPPSTEPGAGGEEMQPGEYVPPAEPMEPAKPAEQQPTSFIFDSLLGAILAPLTQIFQ